MTVMRTPRPGNVVEHAIIGNAPALQMALDWADRLAPTQIQILIMGETGTGKELVARRIHARSERSGPLVDVNCASLDSDLAESLLFGHCRGAFTGAVADVHGHVMRANGGTLFLDELASLHPSPQAKLLRVIETGMVRPVSANTEYRTDIRLICAVQETFGDVIARGEFRRDLYERIAGATIELPPLRERPDDIPLLAEHFASEEQVRITAGGVRVLMAYAWPGNVRELKAVITRAAVMSEGELLEAEVLIEALSQRLPVRSAIAGPHLRNDLEALKLVRTCEAAGWDIGAAAKELKISKSTLYRWLNRHGIATAFRRATSSDM